MLILKIIMWLIGGALGLGLSEFIHQGKSVRAILIVFGILAYGILLIGIGSDGIVEVGRRLDSYVFNFS